MAGSNAESVRVFCRIRPLNSAEQSGGSKVAVDLSEKDAIKVVDGASSTKPFTFRFDNVFRWDCTQEDVYNAAAKPAVDQLLQGFNGTIFAYGQTSSGKTHTMKGYEAGDGRGVIPRVVDAIFEGICCADEQTEFVVRVSMFEIYNEMIKDLLEPSQTNLRVRESREGVHIEDLTEAAVGTEDEVMALMEEGDRNRAVAATNMNEHSSRSHLVVTLNVEQRNLTTRSVKRGKLHLVDLAGSEKIAKTGAEGQRLEEAKKINGSLSALGAVINALTDNTRAHVPYRDSKLTRVLQEALGGNSKTSLIIACSPASVNAQETLGTLRFGQRAKMIQNSARVNVEHTVEELKLQLMKKDEALLVSQARVGVLEQLLSTHRIPLPAGVVPASQPGANLKPLDVTNLADEVDHLRAKLTDKTDEVFELVSRKETLEAQNLELISRVRALEEKQGRAVNDEAQKLKEIVNTFTPAPRQAAAVVMVPATERDEKYRKLEDQMSKLLPVIEELVEAKNKSEREVQRVSELNASLRRDLANSKQKYEKLMDACAGLTRQIAKNGNIPAGVGFQNPARIQRKVKQIVKPLRGGVKFQAVGAPP